MRATLLLAGPLLVAALAGIPAAGSAGSADPGVTAEKILLGGTAPLTGPASTSAAFARGAEAYFEHVNARGGVNGRTIAYTYVDDADDPAQTLAATRRLVEEDRVFAVVNSVGTAHNLATRDYLNRLKVPQLFVASGAAAFGRDHRRYPYTIGFQPSNRAEGWIYGAYLARTKPEAKVGVLFQNDELGKELIAGLRQGIARSKVKLVALESYEVIDGDVEAQIARLKASGANTLALFATATVAVQAYTVANRLGWRPLTVVSTAASASRVMASAAAGGASRSVEGSISISYLKDPVDPRWRADAAMRLYRTVLARYASGANARDVGHVYGMAVAYETVRLLKATGKTPTRAAVAAQLRRLSDASNPFLLPGITIRTSASERFPIEQARLQRWSKGSWRSFGGLWRHPAG